MNILTDQLPTAVEISGVEYPINSDYRAALRVILAFEDPELTGFEKQMIMLDNLFPQAPHDLSGAMEVAMRFLNCGKSDTGKENDEPRLYSFSQDANFIFAAFKQTHGIDLETTEYLHWWKFLALFMDLGSETTFCALVSLRKRIRDGKATKEEQRIYREMREVIDLDQTDARTAEEREREAEFMRLLEAGKRARENN